MSEYLYGAVLLLEPEHDETYFHASCAQMKELGMNLAGVWPPVFY